jgi:hypothetical protein
MNVRAGGVCGKFWGNHCAGWSPSETPGTLDAAGAPERVPRVCRKIPMMHLINLLALAAVPLATAGYGGHLAEKLVHKPDRSKALAIV